MRVINRVETFYGLEGIDNKLESFFDNFNIMYEKFEIKLIMCEAITNAFIHGNARNENKPVCLYGELKDDLLTIVVTDCGCGFENITIPEEINEDNILQDGGRGIYLINCFADEVQFKYSSIIIKKHVIRGE